MTKRPDLEEVFEKTGDSSEKRRVPRLNLTSEQFCLKENNQVFPVTDLSQTGMAIRVLERDDLIHFTVGKTIEGELNLHRKKFPIRATVRNLRADQVGCEFETLSAETTNALKKFLDPKELAHEIHPVPTDPNRPLLWFHGPSGTDILFWKKEEKIRRFLILVYRSFVRWEEESGIQTGGFFYTDDHSEVAGVIRFETVLLEPDAQIDPGKLSVAKTLILSSKMDENLKSECLKALK